MALLFLTEEILIALKLVRAAMPLWRPADIPAQPSKLGGDHLPHTGRRRCPHQNYAHVALLW